MEISRSFLKAAKNIRGSNIIPELRQRYWERPYVVGHYANFAKVKEFCRDTYLLDIGCGTGWAAQLYRSWGCKKVVGIDTDDESLEFAKKFRADKNIDYQKGSGVSLIFPDNSFDIVTCFEVIEHVKEWEFLVSEIKRVLKSGGHFFLSTPNITLYNDIAYANPDHCTDFTWDTFTGNLGAKISGAKFYCRYGEDVLADELCTNVKMIAEKNRIIAAIIGKNSDLLSKCVRRLPLQIQKYIFE